MYLMINNKLNYNDRCDVLLTQMSIGLNFSKIINYFVDVGGKKNLFSPFAILPIHAKNSYFITANCIIIKLIITTTIS